MAKIIDKINAATAPFFSFEYFPPKTDDGVTKLKERQHRMQALGPLFCDITWGAGGSTADLTLEIASAMQNEVRGRPRPARRRRHQASAAPLPAASPRGRRLGSLGYRSTWRR